MRYLEMNADFAVKESVTNATAVGAGTAVDMMGSDGRAHQVIVIGTAVATGHEFKVQESDDNSTWTDISGTTTPVGVEIKALNLKNTKRFIRGYVTAVNGTTDGITVALIPAMYDNPR